HGAALAGDGAAAGLGIQVGGERGGRDGAVPVSAPLLRPVRRGGVAPTLSPLPRHVVLQTTGARVARDEANGDIRLTSAPARGDRVDRQPQRVSNAWAHHPGQEGDDFARTSAGSQPERRSIARGEVITRIRMARPCGTEGPFVETRAAAIT